MAGGCLPISDIEDHVDIVGQEAWVRFKCSGKPTRLNCTVRDDWLDRQSSPIGRNAR